MQFGVCLPHRWLYASADTIASFAREAEALGYDSLWVTDHIFVPEGRMERGHIFFEALMTLSYVASITERCRLGTTVLAIPPRNPLLLAKQVATLDALSGGRVVLGVGTGWIHQELEYMGVEWEKRGKMLDEGIRVLKDLWSETSPNSYEGSFVRYRDLLFFPKPPQPGGPSILVGGMTDPSLKRAARLGDGWIPWAVSPQEVRSGIEKIRTWRGEAPFQVVCFMPADIGSGDAATYTGVFGEVHTVLNGPVEAVSRAVEALATAGVQELVCSFRDVRLFRDENMDEIRRQMDLFAREVMPGFQR